MSVSVFSKRFPHTAQAVREFVASDDPHGLGFASAWLLTAVDVVLELDRKLTPQTVITKEARQQCGQAIIDLQSAYEEFERATQRRHEAENEVNRSLH